MSDALAPLSTTGATYIEPSAEVTLEPGTKIGDLFRRNMTQPYVLQRLTERAYWIQSFTTVRFSTSAIEAC